MSERASDRWISAGMSVLLHGGLITLLAVGWWNFKKAPKPEPPVPAIDALVVDSRTLAAIPAARAPAPPPKEAPPPEPVPEPQPEPPKPSPEEGAQQEEKRQAEEKRVVEEKAAEERAQAEQQAREEAERKAREAEEAKKRLEEQKLAEQKKQEEAKRQAEEKRKQEEARQEAERQGELRKSMEEEERVMAARSSGAMATWIQQITARIQRAWIRPPSARPGIDCVLLVTQVPGGEVVSVRVASCNGDEAVRESIEAAAYRASPLPPPPDPAMFDRNLEIRFRPVD